MRNNTSDIPTLYQIFYDKDYNLEYPFEPEIILDLGANIGLSSVYFKNKFPNSKIIAVEPEKSNYDLLNCNTEKYQDIHVLNAGVWYKDTNLKVENNGLGHWGFITTEVENETSNSIKSISIDSIMKKYDLGCIDILKIDIEGSEKELFEYYGNWINNVNCIIIELHDTIKKGCTECFNKAINGKNFMKIKKGENVILFKNKK